MFTRVTHSAASSQTRTDTGLESRSVNDVAPRRLEKVMQCEPSFKCKSDERAIILYILSL